MKPLNIIGLTVFIIGALLLFGSTVYKITKDMIHNADIPMIIILGITGVLVGMIIILIFLVIERIKDNKKEILYFFMS